MKSPTISLNRSKIPLLLFKCVTFSVLLAGICSSISCSKKKKDKNPPIPDGISSVRITIPADRIIFYSVYYDVVEGNTYSSRTISGSKRSKGDDTALEIPIDKYDPAKHTGIHIQILAPFETSPSAELLASTKVLETKTKGNGKNFIELKYGQLISDADDRNFDYLKPTSSEAQFVDMIINTLRTSSVKEYNSDNSDEAFLKAAPLGLRALSKGLKEKFGEVKKSSLPWVSATRDNNRKLLEGEILAGNAIIPLMIGTKDDKMYYIQFLSPNQEFRLVNFAEEILEEHARKFLTHVHKKEKDQYMSMMPEKNSMPADRLDRVPRLFESYWKEGDSLKYYGLRILRERKGEIQYLGIFKLSTDPPVHPIVLYSYHHSKPESNWELVEFPLADFGLEINPKNIETLKKIITP